MSKINRPAWQEFEMVVTKLLKAAGYDVTHNILIADQQVDVLAIKNYLGERIRTAVECKHYENALTKEDIAKVWIKYDSLYEKDLIDKILLITKNPISAAAKSFISNKRNIQHLTISELQSNIIDFECYVRNHIEIIKENGLIEYYISLTSNNKDLELIIDDWLYSTDSTPISILAGYGKGKSSFAQHYCSKQAQKWIENPAERIPIFIDLGKISDEQSLEGLLGKLMTTDYNVNNYSFDLFMELNRLGRFLIFFDSFDEMKHGISWASFINNIEQIKRLQSDESKIIILGRPSIFLDENEKNEIINNTYKVGNKWIKETSFTGFKELTIDFFNSPKIEQFLFNYLNYLKNRNVFNKKAKFNVFERISADGAKNLLELAKRPVQLLMIANILPEWHEPINNLTKSLLFDYFINLIIRRENKKNARSRISNNDRRFFARELAWHLWNSNRTDYIRTDDIPLSIINDIKSSTANIDSKKRELVVGSSLEFKPPDLLYFPHRSIQEFLVSEKMIEELNKKTISLIELETKTNNEIKDFISGLITSDDLVNSKNLVLSHKGVMHKYSSELYLLDNGFKKEMLGMIKEGITNPWPGIVSIQSGPNFIDLIKINTPNYVVYGLYRLFLNNFHDNSGSDAKFSWHYNYNFSTEITSILKLNVMQKKMTPVTEIVTEVFSLLHLKRQHKNLIIDLGNLRKYFKDFFTSSAYTEIMFDYNNRFQPKYDIVKRVAITNNLEIDRLLRLSERIKNHKY